MEKNISLECAKPHARCIPETISDYIYNGIVKIIIGTSHGTGFFIIITENSKTYKFLLSCEHVIPKEIIDKKVTISLLYGKFKNEKKFEIKLDNKERYIKSFKQIDITMIEILEKDYIPENKFLIIDRNYLNGYVLYQDKSIYLAGYPNNMNGVRCISSGKIEKIEEIKGFDELEGKYFYEFEHSLDTEEGSSGSPICLSDNRYVIGIHRGSDKINKINYGLFIGGIFDIIFDYNLKKMQIIMD